MDGVDGWRLAASGGDGAPDKTIISTIMHRFRPIAPKPVTGGSVSVGSVPENMSKALFDGKRVKRKYVRVRRNSGYRRKNIRKSSDQLERRDGLENAVVTLQLMPENTKPEEGSVAEGSWCKNVDLDLMVEKIEIQNNQVPPTLLQIKASVAEDVHGSKMLDRRVVESWVTVESVTDACMDVGGLGCTDVEKIKNLQSDTCPGFISDGFNRVPWVNEAYKRMVSGERNEVESEAEIMVRLKVMDHLLFSYPAFSCGVRLQYTRQKEKCTKMVPCDVWRLNCGGFAWRLDIKAALSLGLR